jgi:hypothetical protein
MVYAAAFCQHSMHTTPLRESEMVLRDPPYTARRTVLAFWICVRKACTAESKKSLAIDRTESTAEHAESAHNDQGHQHRHPHDAAAARQAVQSRGQSRIEKGKHTTQGGPTEKR